MTTRTILCLVFAIAVSLTAISADAPDDAKALAGTWLPVKGELAGRPMPEAVLKTITLKLAKGEYVVTVAGNPGPDQGTFRLDSSAALKGMTIIGTNGPNLGKIFPAIYELKGDTLQICYDLSGVKRPTSFNTIAGTKLYLVTYHRKNE